MQSKTRILLLRFTSLLLLTMWTSSLSAVDIFVATTGLDTNSGTQDAPLRTMAGAKSLARKFVGDQAVTVHVADGVYYLPESLVFTPADSGAAEHPVVYKASNGGGAILSGGSELKLDWKPYRDGIFMAATDPGLQIDQLFVNGLNQRMARYPNYDAAKKTEAYQGFAADAFSKQRAAGWDDPEGGFIHAMHRSRWGGYHYRITGKGDSGEVTYEGGWQNNRKSGMHDELRMVENIFEELDVPGEWFHNSDKNTLYYMPVTNVDLASAKIEVVRLRHLIEFEGSAGSPVKFITLDGFTVRHAARTFMETKEPLLRSDWAIYRGGAIVVSGSEDVQILNCEFDQVGGNAVFVNYYNRRVLVEGCHIHDAGASGVCFVGDPDAVRDPLFEYGQKNDLSKIDRTPGPKTNNYPADSTVQDCLIHGIGRVERQPAGVLIEMAQRITVRDCSVYDCARAGINIGDGAWGGHLIEGCDVFDTVQETHDHGSFNSWGRDRYWRSDQPVTQAAVDQEPNLPLLDAVETTVIRNSRWRCDHGWDIDLDDGSSNYHIYNNLLLAGGLKLREGFHRRAWNNITVNNGLHPHVWYNHSQDEVYPNIFMAPARGARMPSEIAKGKRVDGNLYYNVSEEQMNRHAEFGWEVNSIIGDPLFVDPPRGDFRVRKGSPAFKIGFENFPMDQFGVKKPALKEIAEMPVIPPLAGSMKTGGSAVATPLKPAVSIWLGAELHALEGEEFSAYGTRREDGGVALKTVPRGSAAAEVGLQQNDLIQSLNGQKVSDVSQLFKVLSRTREVAVTLHLVRNQQLIEVSIEQPSVVEVETASAATAFFCGGAAVPVSINIKEIPIVKTITHPTIISVTALSLTAYLFAAAAVTAIAQDSTTANNAVHGKPFTGEKTNFRGFDRYKVDTALGTISVVCPKQSAPGKPWMWRSMFWGMNSPAVNRVTDGDLRLVEQGYHVVIAPGDVAGHPRGNALIDAAYETLTQDYGFSKTLSMGSISRENLALFRWASVNPEKVESIYIDNGVCNVKSWPAGKVVPGSGSEADGNPNSWTGMKEAYGFTDEELLAAEVSPIDLLEPLAKAGVPILMVCGTQDTTVPYEENGAIMKERYEKLGGDIKIILAEKGHHPHGLEDATEVVKFILNARERPAPNSVLILTDDLGWQDVKCYDIDEPSPYETPNMDVLAAKGSCFGKRTRRHRPMHHLGARS